MTTSVEWEQALRALAEMVTRVTTLLRSVTTPRAPAVGSWNVAEVAMHLSQAWLVVPGMAAEDLSEIDEVLTRPDGVSNSALIADIGDLAATTAAGVQSDPERDLGVLADRIEKRATAFLATAADDAPTERRAWMVDGTTVSLPALTGHLLNETIVHGYDIARGAGRPWPIEPAHAALVASMFIVPIFRALDPAAMVHPRAASIRATFDLRLRGGRSFYFVFDRGQLRVEDPSSRRVDCHISADPVAFLLVAWGRRNQWEAIAKGQLVAWGIKPWLGPQFRRLIRNP